VSNPSCKDVTYLLDRIQHGDASARNELLTVVSSEFYEIARHFMNHERRDHTLTPTALAHEAVIRLINEAAFGQAENRAHFFGIVARCMWQVLVHHARGRAAERRGGSWTRHPLDDALDYLAARGVDDPLCFDQLLDELETIDPRQRAVVEFRFLLELSVRKTAELLGVSERTIELDLQKARAWLYLRLQGV
jgi:RNA polymerase sigma factor (TIGR02999 family)